jgi:glutathione peroxidase
MKPIFIIAAIAAITAFTLPSTKTIYNFKVPSIDGGSIDFSKYKGKKILIVNTASECQYTYQYAALQTLYSTHKNKLVVIGFPSNQFGAQEPGTESDIQTFCKTRYGVTFPMSVKTNVKGDSIAPIYKWLCNKNENGVLDAEIKWNFNKFLLNENGKLIAHFASNVAPDSKEILQYLK